MIWIWIRIHSRCLSYTQSQLSDLSNPQFFKFTELANTHFSAFFPSVAFLILLGFTPVGNAAGIYLLSVYRNQNLWSCHYHQWFHHQKLHSWAFWMKAQDSLVRIFNLKLFSKLTWNSFFEGAIVDLFDKRIDKILFRKINIVVECKIAIFHSARVFIHWKTQPTPYFLKFRCGATART